MEDTTRAFAEWVSATARGLGFRTDAQLAKALGVQQSTVTRWRTGSQPQIKHLVAISRLFKMKIEPLLALSGHVPPELLSNNEVPQSPLPVTASQRMIRDAHVPLEVKEVFERYWESRLREERNRLSALMHIATDVGDGRDLESTMAEHGERALENKMATHLMDALAESQKALDGLAPGSGRRKARRKRPTLKRGEILDITLRGVTHAKVVALPEGAYRFELLDADNAALIVSSPYESASKAQEALKTLMDSIAIEPKVAPDATEEQL
ncbi:helix-turn-helix domain-containing protein [Streptosporangium sp. KLBMP 9127]|nr:helix-turn-helix domain-containing protein [Streptosporangium sp. KLBMP 9127]